MASITSSLTSSMAPLFESPAKLGQSLNRYKKWDDRRKSLPGEHWLVMCAGIGILLLSTRSRSPAKRALVSAVGGAFLARAASGRDGVASLLNVLPAARSLLR